RAEKEYRLYGTWSDEELHPLPPDQPLPYWFALKAKLPRWRADADARTAWHQTMAIRHGRPVVDPDVIGPADFVRPRMGQPAYDLWRTRNNELDGMQANLHQLRTAAADLRSSLDAVCQSTLGSGSQALLDLAMSPADASILVTRIAQMNLTPRE